MEKKKTSRKIVRSIRHAVDLETMTTISSDDLMALSTDDYHEIRRAATGGRLDGIYRYACAQCGHGVYAPREPTRRLPYWRHFRGAPVSCEWWTGDPESVDRVSAAQFEGAQESPLHVTIKNTVADLLNADPLMEPGSVRVDEYVAGGSGRRRPDVRATYADKKIAFEVQLATTQIPIIMARERFYEAEGYRLVWLTWQFSPGPRARMLTAFEDIYYSHNHNIFSLDPETVRESRKQDRVLLRVYWERDAAWQSKLVPLANLNWLENGLAYAVAPPLPWHLDFRERWLALCRGRRPTWIEQAPLVEELMDVFGIEDQSTYAFAESGIVDIVNCTLSFYENHPVGSDQKNLIEVLNTFFHAESRHPYVRLIERVARVAGNQEILERDSVRRKLEHARRSSRQAGQTSTIGRMTLTLFPELADR